MFKVGTTYKAKYDILGKWTNTPIVKKGSTLKCIRDGQMKRLAYYTKSGTEMSWHISHCDRNDFTVAEQQDE